MANQHSQATTAPNSPTRRSSRSAVPAGQMSFLAEDLIARQEGIAPSDAFSALLSESGNTEEPIDREKVVRRLIERLADES